MQFAKLALTALTATGVSAQVTNSTSNSTTSSNSSATSLTSVLGTVPDLSTLTALLGSYPAFLSSLSNATNLTILAPSNDAIAALHNTSVGDAAEVPGYIEALLTYHVLNGTIYASQFTNDTKIVATHLTNTSYTNVTAGQVVAARLDEGNVTIFSGLQENVTVIEANLNFTGGVIHVIDRVLTIPVNLTTTTQAANLTALTGAIEALNLTTVLDELSDLTIFAPTNAAFQAVGEALANASTSELLSILEYHAINGTVAYSPTLSNTTVTTLGGQNLTITVIDGAVFVNSARVVNPDVLISNGVMHVIDAVLNPANTTQTPVATATSAQPEFTVTSTDSVVPFTSGVTAPTSTVPAGNTVVSTSSGAAVPMKTGAVGAAALFGGAAMIANW